VADVPVLVCSCGKRLRAPGAIPGRVGRCPDCGAELRVPDASPSRNLEQDSAPATRPPRRKKARKRPTAPASTEVWDGLIRAPQRPETHLWTSLLYPFWGATGIALLVFLPPVLWLFSMPGVSLIAAALNGQSVMGIGWLLLGLPSTMGVAVVLGYALLYLGRVLVSSALGEVHHPRWPDGSPGEIARGFGRWFWALLVGGVSGGFPAVAYWVYCGDIDTFDVIVLSELVALGAVYAQMALLASILHDDPLGANPITVLRALRRVGWDCLRPSLVTGFALVLAAGATALLFAIEYPLLAAVTLWAFWVFLLYEAMVVLRVLGLFYFRHARTLGWFHDRPRWGA
jgi:hypothetical protein